MKKSFILLFIVLYCVTSWGQALKRQKDDITDKWGFLNNRGEWVIRPTFDDANAYGFMPDNAVVKYKGKWGAINKKGEFSVKPVFTNEAGAFSAVEQLQKNEILGKTLYIQKDDETKKWGFLNYLGDWAIRPVFDYANGYGFMPDNAVVKYKGKWGGINKKGEFTIKPVFSNEGSAFNAVEKLQQNEILGKTLYMQKDSETEKWGFLNYLGNWAILPIYENCNGYGFDSHLATVKYKGKWGAINKKGEFVIKNNFAYEGEAFTAAQTLQKSGEIETVLPSEVANYTDKNAAPAAMGIKQQPAASQQTVAEAGNITQTPADRNPAAAAVPATPPTVKILSPHNGSNYTSGEVNIAYSTKTSDGNAPDILVSVNGKAYNMQTKGVKRASNELVLKLPTQGTNYVQLIARDSKGLTSEPVSIELNYTGGKLKPTLHMVSVGVSKYNDRDIKDLMFGAKDAVDFANTITKNKSDLYKEIKQPVVLTNEKATALKIKTALNTLAKNVEQGDVVFLFFSGHGAEEDGDKYFLSADAESGNLYSTAVNFEDINRAMRILKDKLCSVIIFMDACHAGGLFATKNVQSKVYEIPVGITGFLSSTSMQKSVEDPKWNNGIFTRALIDGMNGKAKDANGHVNTLDLGNYIKSTVMKETKQSQSPTTQNAIGEFILF
ncbi:WG repeat-containing protein [Paludibacter sp. 221]|uniref:WG repeat-containing protein n=1 Tax=Paludibacter sp. 221 TaxID=2302939 RepID=UPI0013D3840F|nr:WG repeat-containing protein [Paludibacter sp. 221]